MTVLAKVLLVDDEREFVAILTQRLTKRNRDKLILEVYMTPYLTQRERDEQVAKILDPKAKSSGV